MLKVIDSEGKFTPVNGIIYKKNIIDLLEVTKDVKKRAERNAKRILENARVEAEEIKELAFSQGYQDGYTKVINETLSFIVRSKENTRKIREDILSDVQSLLTTVTTNTEFLLTIISEWLMKVDKRANRVLLKFPEKYRINEDIIIDGITRKWMGDVKVEYHNSTSIIIYCENKIAEFDAPGFIKDALHIIADKYDVRIIDSIKNIAMENSKNIINTAYEE